MLILGSCLALNLSYSGCCVLAWSPPCSNNGCYCDQNCFIFNDCCSDIADLGCHPASSLSPTVSIATTHTPGKTKSEASHFIFISMCDKIIFYPAMYSPINSTNKIIKDLKIIDVGNFYEIKSFLFIICFSLYIISKSFSSIFKE